MKFKKRFGSSLLFLIVLAAGINGQVQVRPEPAPPRLIAELRAPDETTRRNAAMELGALRSRDAVNGLAGALTDKSKSVREAAAFALGQITDKRGVTPLLRAMRDPDGDVRAAAAFALGMIEERIAVAALSRALDDREPSVRGAALAALGLMQDDEAIEEVVQMLNDASFDVRYDAVWALWRIGDPAGLDHLRVMELTLDSMAIDRGRRDALRQAIGNAIEYLEMRDGLPARPRRATEGVIQPNRYDDETRHASLRMAVKPAPTEQALRARVRGSVGLRVLIGADGRVVRAYVTRRLGSGLDQRAMQAAMQYRFDPAMLRGIPQTTWVALEVQF